MASTDVVDESGEKESNSVQDMTDKPAMVEGNTAFDIPRSGDPAYQWLFSQSDMTDTPSILLAGLTYDQERFNRWKGVQLIFRIGDYMRLGNHVTCTASMFFQRFFMRKQMSKEGGTRTHDTFAFPEMAPTCVFLACKVEETHRKLHNIVEATMAVLDRTPVGIQRCEAHMYRADISSRDYQRWRDIVLLQEERLLEALCFDLIIDQPHPIALKGSMRIGVSRDMAQLTILLLNTFLYGAVCLFYDSATLAACAFLKACQYTKKDPQSYLIGTPYAEHKWSEAFDVELEEVEEAMPIIDEYLAYHQEKIAPPPSTAQSAATTPLITQHSSMGKEPMNGTKQPRFAESPIIQEAKEDSVTFAINLPPSSETEEQNPVEQESRTDSFRPISRHGSKTGSFGPPPPMSVPVTEGTSETPAVVPKPTYTLQSPKLNQPEQESAQSIDPHQEAAAEKVAHEQAKLERQEAIKPSEDTQGEGSEEEGAL
ncbi:hypothetical protein L7F22_019062 [Adiantum nelumboides]|nr:hypothetical protein [Adiantum nelumboides]